LKKYGETLQGMSIEKDILVICQTSQEIRAKIDKLESFCIAKETINRVKRLLTDWEKYF
jgi:hypothetical protein